MSQDFLDAAGSGETQPSPPGTAHTLHISGKPQTETAVPQPSAGAQSALSILASVATLPAPTPPANGSSFSSSGGPSSTRAPAPAAVVAPGPAPTLPTRYGVDRLVLLVRDPSWLYAYWEVSDATWAHARRLAEPVPNPVPNGVAAGAGNVWEKSRTILRLISWGEPAAGSAVWETDVGTADNWYIHLPDRGRPLQAELVQRLPDGREISLLRSNIAFLPPAEPSSLVDEEWLTIEEVWERFLGLQPGAGSEQILRAMQTRWQRHLASPGAPGLALMSPGFSPGFSWGKRPPSAQVSQLLWLQVGTDLVLYGATDPSAEVRVGGTPVALQPDGSFHLRFTLEDGELVLPVTAHQPQTGQRQQVTISVQRASRHD